MASCDDITSMDTLTISDTETMPMEEETLSPDDKPEFDDTEPTSRPESTTRDDKPQHGDKDDEASNPEFQGQGKFTLPSIAISKVGQFEVRHKTDKKKYLEIKRIKFTPDGRVLMIDRINKALKIFSSKMHILYSLSLPGSPEDLDVTSDSEAVVLVTVSGRGSSLKHYLMFIAITEAKLALKNKLKLDFIPSYFAMCSDMPILSCVYGDPCLIKIDRNGKHEWRTKLSGQCLDIALMPREAMFAECEWADGKMALRRVKTGQSVREFQMDEKTSTQISVDPLGNIYMFCLKKYQILLQVITDELNLSHAKVLLSESDGLGKYPTSIGYDHARNLLYIAYLFVGDKTNYVDCFQLPNGLYSKGS